MLPRRLVPVALVTLTLLLTALAGCIQEGGSLDGDGGSDAPALTEAAAFALFEDALANMDPRSADHPDRLSIRLRAEALNASDAMTLEALMDAEVGLVVATMEQEGGETDESDWGNPFGDAPFIMATAWKTTFLGTEESLFGAYNASAEPPTHFEDTLGAGPMGGEDEDAYTDAMQRLGTLTPADIERVERVLHEGRDAVALTVNATDGHAAVRGTITVYADPALPAYADLIVSDPGSDEPLDGDARLRFDMRYGPDARHDLEDTVKRLETMTLFTESDADPYGGYRGERDETGETFTIQPSHFNDHRARLDKVEVHVFRGGEPGEEPVLVLEAADGSAENEDVRVTFTDADGDARVSPGDTIRMEWKTDAGEEHTLGLYDEESGILLAPGAGALAALAATALAGAVAHARRRR